MIQHSKIDYFRFLTIALISLYTVVLIWNYIVWLAPVWGYMGVDYSPVGTYYFLACLIASVLPSIWIPISISRPTMVTYWILYLLTYIPMIVGVSLSPKFTFIQVILFQLSCLFSFTLTGAGYYFKLIKIKEKYIPKFNFWVAFYSAMFLMFLYVIYIFKGNFKLVSPFDENLYDLRFSGRDVAEGDKLVGYFTQWLSGAFLPFLLAIGIVYKKKLLILISCIGQIILYSTAANKAFILSIIYMVGIYYITKKTSKFGIFLTFFLIILITFLTFSQIYFEDDFKLIFFPITSIIMLRTISISTINAVNYYDFFSNNPFTYYSHINIIGKFIRYPYGDLALGQVIGVTMSGNADSNWNANFYITDGFVAMGYSGLIIIGIISGLIFYIIDSLIKSQNIILCTLLITISSVSLMNVSIFTTLLTGGLIYLILFLVLFENKSLS